MQIEISNNCYWPPKYDLTCRVSQCPVGLESKFGQEFYQSQIECPLILCPLCRFKEKKCPVPNCQIALEKHNLKTNFTIQFNKLFCELDIQVQEQLKVRQKIKAKYHRQIEDLKLSSKALEINDQLQELLEEAIYADISENNKLSVQIDQKINQLWREMETEDDYLMKRPPPSLIQKTSQIHQQGQPINYSKEAGLNEKQFHISRISHGF